MAIIILIYKISNSFSKIPNIEIQFQKPIKVQITITQYTNYVQCVIIKPWTQHVHHISQHVHVNTIHGHSFLTQCNRATNFFSHETLFQFNFHHHHLHPPQWPHQFPIRALYYKIVVVNSKVDRLQWLIQQQDTVNVVRTNRLEKLCMTSSFRSTTLDLPSMRWIFML